MLSLLVLSSLATAALASWSNNLNYRSPSDNHPGLGISIHKVAKRNVEGRAVNYKNLNFTHGVASGDPYPNSVVLWTRAAPRLNNDRSNVTVSGFVPLYSHETEQYVNASTSPICVAWKIASDEELTDVVNEGTAYTTSDIDFTVKVIADGLSPFTWYWYQFNVCGSFLKSPLGRTKTTPRANDESADVGLAVYSCSNFPFGFFNAYGNPVRKGSVDYVIHLGDYLYESKNGDYGDGRPLDRVPQPNREIYTLYDYRRRHATYKTDLDLLASHQSYPWIPVWDDHEVSDNTYRDGASGLNNTEESFTEDGGVSVDQRKMNAVRAYFEWMPIRQVEMDDNLRIWRRFSIGKLIDLIMLDTRQYDRSITDLYWNTEYIRKIANDAGRSLMGSRQENWFYDQLTRSHNRGAAWRIVGSQIVFAALNETFTQGSPGTNVDAWSGYLSNRNRTLYHLYSNGIPNNIFLAGDSHANWVSDLVWLDNQAGAPPYNPITGEGSIGAEFAGTAVSSPSPVQEDVLIKDANKASRNFVRDTPELQWSETYFRGYFELRVSYERVQAHYFGMPTLLTRNAYEIPLANFTVVSGENKLQRPVGNGLVLNGKLKGGVTQITNATNSTDTGRWSVTSFAKEDSCGDCE